MLQVRIRSRGAEGPGECAERRDLLPEARTEARSGDGGQDARLILVQRCLARPQLKDSSARKIRYNYYFSEKIIKL